jgi:hypothetical protein
MKIIISESQEVSLYRFNFFKKFVGKLLSKYDWFESFDIQISTYQYNTYTPNGLRKYEVPQYTIFVKSNNGVRIRNGMDIKNGMEIKSEDYYEISEEIDITFTLLFPYDDNGKPPVVWDIIIN